MRIIYFALFWKHHCFWTSEPFDCAQESLVELSFNLAYGIEAYHIGGHTWGFTMYIYQDVLFICDYVFLSDASMSFNPYGPAQETSTHARRIYEIVSGKALKTVCGYNYVTNFADWLVEFECLVLNR